MRVKERVRERIGMKMRMMRIKKKLTVEFMTIQMIIIRKMVRKKVL